MNNDLHFDYTTVGHVTVDVLADGSRRVGGSAFYSALQAARLGKRALIVTQGVAREIEQLLDPYRHELELRVLPATSTTTLLTSGSDAGRSQRVQAWAGPITHALELDTAILHLAPVAREISGEWADSSASLSFVGLTPQGLARAWDAEDGHVEHVRPDASAEQLARRCHALVLSDYERDVCADVIACAHHAGALVAVTAGAAPTTILLPNRDTQKPPSAAGPAAPRQGVTSPGAPALEIEVPALEQPVDDLGAGDVFAAAFFIALHEGRAPGSAAAFANAAAAVRMRAAGADAIGGRQQIEDRLSRAPGPR